MTPENLPSHDVDPRVALRIGRLARAALARERRLAERPALATAVRWWNGVLEPSLCVAAVVGYLAWLAGTLLPLL